MSNRTYFITRLVILLAALTSGLTHAEVLYVSDKLGITLRDGPGQEYRALRKTVTTGNSVNYYGVAVNGWSRIEAPGGQVGWLKTRYLIDEPTTQMKLKSANISIDEVIKLNEKLELELQTVKRELDQYLAAQFPPDPMQKHLDKMSKDELRQKISMIDQEKNLLANQIDILRANNDRLDNKTQQTWFFYGGSVLFMSVLLVGAIGKFFKHENWL